ncbi:hypothetical protein FD724_37775 (plasmid) [Nostoc sp. C057]|uniref:NACHT domain-containing protein n=1 Tax=Nostoc sp. C057 TaxID=2576903 RepID=UPI0015C3C391|nr:hypothetical protein [Nostoc sp. C057]QLE53610.1 hypothetical protein FD724_37775 [Nostoc sp. C057]
MDFYEWKKGQITGEQRKQLNAALKELAREAIDKEATRFRLRQQFVYKYLGEPDDPDSLFALALRLGWLNQVGVDADHPRREVYAFFHPTFQEYFAAIAIENWHFFLNHIPQNDSYSDASYRLFEPQWKQVFLLWLGRNNILNQHKEDLVQALVNFEDRWGNYYKHQAYFLAASGIAEFKDFSKADAIIKEIIELSLDTKPFIAKEAQLILIETDRIRVINHLYILLDNAHTTLRKRQIIKLLGRVDPNNQKAISTLDYLLQETDLDIFERIQIAEELGQIDVGNLKAVSTLIDMLYINQDHAWWSANGRGEVGDGSRAEFGFSIMFAVAALEEISDGSEEIVNALIEVLKKNRIPDVRNRVILSLNKFNSNLAHFILNRVFEQAE